MIGIQNEHDDEIKKKVWNELDDTKDTFFTKYGGYLMSVILICVGCIFREGQFEDDSLIYLEIPGNLILLVMSTIFLSFWLPIFGLGGFKKFQRNFTILCIIWIIMYWTNPPL